MIIIEIWNSSSNSAIQAEVIDVVVVEMYRECREYKTNIKM